MDKYSVLYKAFELACKDLGVVNNPNGAPLKSIMSYYLSKSEKELSIVDKYSPNTVNNNTVKSVKSESTNNSGRGSNPSSHKTTEDQPFADSAKELNVNYTTELLIKSKDRLCEVCNSIFNEEKDYNLNYYKSDYLDALEKFLSKCRSSKSNDYVNKTDLINCINVVIDSLHCSHYRLTSSKEQFDSSVIVHTSNCISELNSILNSF